MQQVEVYYDLLDAAREMRTFIGEGWRVHTCSISTHKNGCSTEERVLVVYER